MVQVILNELNSMQQISPAAIASNLLVSLLVLAATAGLAVSIIVSEAFLPQRGLGVKACNPAAPREAARPGGFFLL